MSRGPFFFFFWLSLFETTEICLGSTKYGNFYQEKKAFGVGKKSGKVTLPLLKNIPLMPLNINGAYFRALYPYLQRVKSSLSSRPITGSLWTGLATFLVTCPVDRLN